MEAVEEEVLRGFFFVPEQCGSRLNSVVMGSTRSAHVLGGVHAKTDGLGRDLIVDRSRKKP